MLGGMRPPCRQCKDNPVPRFRHPISRPCRHPSPFEQGGNDAESGPQALTRPIDIGGPKDCQPARTTLAENGKEGFERYLSGAVVGTRRGSRGFIRSFGIAIERSPGQHENYPGFREVLQAFKKAQRWKQAGFRLGARAPSGIAGRGGRGQMDDLLATSQERANYCTIALVANMPLNAFRQRKCCLSGQNMHFTPFGSETRCQSTPDEAAATDKQDAGRQNS